MLQSSYKKLIYLNLNAKIKKKTVSLNPLSFKRINDESYPYVDRSGLQGTNGFHRQNHDKRPKLMF